MNEKSQNISPGEHEDEHKEQSGLKGFPSSLINSAAEGIGKLAGQAHSLEISKQFESAKQAFGQSVEKVRETEIGKHLDSARETVGDSIDKLTGARFREEFEKFTDAVTKVVLGVHREQAELRAQLGRLDKVVTELQSRLGKQKQQP
jgi:hypothetical protein